VPVERAVDRDALVGQAPLPLKQPVAVGDRQREVVGAADPRMPRRRARPLEEGDDRAGCADLVAEVEVVAAGVVEVDRLLDEAQPEHARVEVDRALRVRADERDVVDALDRHRFAPQSSVVGR
jgi:hypothetical protein